MISNRHKKILRKPIHKYDFKKENSRDGDLNLLFYFI